MSYHADVSFKSVTEHELYPLFQKFKAEVMHHLDDIAKDEFVCCPSCRLSHLYEGAREYFRKEADENWARSVFNFRFAYLPELGIVAFFGVPYAARGVFDATICFQNSCDQDYSLETWAKVKPFARISEKWERESAENILKKCREEQDGECDEDEIDVEYYRRAFAYEEVWETISTYSGHDDEAVNLSILGPYDYFEIDKFVRACRKHYAAWEEEWRKNGMVL